MVLHELFLIDAVTSLAFLVPFIVVLWLRSRSSGEVAKSLTYIATGFLIEFLTRFVGGLLRIYVIQLPLLPLKLHREGVPFEVIARTISLYNLAFTATYIATLFLSLLLVTYGVYRLVSALGKR